MFPGKPCLPHIEASQTVEVAPYRPESFDRKRATSRDLAARQFDGPFTANEGVRYRCAFREFY
jgi:hypothetical protein